MAKINLIQIAYLLSKNVSGIYQLIKSESIKTINAVFRYLDCWPFSICELVGRHQYPT